MADWPPYPRTGGGLFCEESHSGNASSHTILLGFFAEQPGIFSEKCAAARDLPLIARSARELSRSARDLNTKCRTARDLTQMQNGPGLHKMVKRPGILTNEVDQPGILTQNVDQPGI